MAPVAASMGHRGIPMPCLAPRPSPRTRRHGAKAPKTPFTPSGIGTPGPSPRLPRGCPASREGRPRGCSRNPRPRRREGPPCRATRVRAGIAPCRTSLGNRPDAPACPRHAGGPAGVSVKAAMAANPLPSSPGGTGRNAFPATCPNRLRLPAGRAAPSPGRAHHPLRPFRPWRWRPFRALSPSPGDAATIRSSPR
jgi:hypothetical protein